MGRRLMVLALLCAMSASARAASPPAIKFVVFFQEWSAALDDAAQGAVKAAADYAKQHPQALITVVGIADPTGSTEANDLLSKLRAQMVIDQMLDNGIPRGRMRRVGHGSQDFSLSSQESRRVEISVGAH